MTNLLQQILPERKDVDRHMINNVRIRVQRKKLDLDSKSIQIDPKYFDTTFIRLYVDTDYNYTQGKSILFLYSLTYFILIKRWYICFKFCLFKYGSDYGISVY